MNNDCLFCKIAQGQIPSTKIYEDDQILVFNDIAPVAPIHMLIIPKKHILSSAREITAEHGALLAHMLQTAAKLAEQNGLDQGYRIVTNVGQHGGQTVHHLHLHLIGGAPLGQMA